MTDIIEADSMNVEVDVAVDERRVVGKVCEKCKMSALHMENRVLRKLSKIFLAHVWTVWREKKGLPTRNPYVVDYLHHELKYPPLREPEK